MFQYLFVQTSGLLESYEIITILGAFLFVLIGAELLKTIKAYFKENLIHVEIVILFAIIAISRKIILIESKGMTGFEFALGLMGYGLIVICLGSGYLLVKKSGIAARERIPESPE